MFLLRSELGGVERVCITLFILDTIEVYSPLCVPSHNNVNIQEGCNQLTPNFLITWCCVVQSLLRHPMGVVGIHLFVFCLCRCEDCDSVIQCFPPLPMPWPPSPGNSCPLCHHSGIDCPAAAGVLSHVISSLPMTQGLGTNSPNCAWNKLWDLVTCLWKSRNTGKFCQCGLWVCFILMWLFVIRRKESLQCTHMDKMIHHSEGRSPFFAGKPGCLAQSGLWFPEGSQLRRTSLPVQWGLEFL